MNLNTYHKYWMMGFSEEECCIMAEQQWEQDQYWKEEQERLDREYEELYYTDLIERLNE